MEKPVVTKTGFSTADFSQVSATKAGLILFVSMNSCILLTLVLGTRDIPLPNTISDLDSL